MLAVALPPCVQLEVAIAADEPDDRGDRDTVLAQQNYAAHRSHAIQSRRFKMTRVLGKGNCIAANSKRIQKRAD